MDIVLTQLLEEDLNAGDAYAQKIIQLMQKSKLTIDDVIILQDALDALPALSDMSDNILSDAIESITLHEFVKDIDFLLSHLFQGTGKKSIENKNILLEARKYLNDEIDFEQSIHSNLIKLIGSVKNNEFRLRIKFIFDKIASMLVEGSSNSEDSENSESSEYFSKSEVDE